MKEVIKEMPDREERKRIKDNKRVLKDLQQNDNDLRELITDNNRRITSALYGVDQEFIDKNRNEIDQINSVIRKVSDKYKEITGDGTIEFLTKMLYDGEIESTRNRYVTGGKLDLNSVIDTANSGIINEMFIDEKDRFALYDDYEALYQYIPQLSQAIQVFCDNIMSPDDFTKDVFTLSYNSNNASTGGQEVKIMGNLKRLEENYKLEEKLTEWIIKTLYLGDQFIAILSLNKELSQMMNEDNTLIDNTHQVPFSESNVLLSEDEMEKLNGFYREDTGNGKDEVNWKQDLIDIMNKNIVYSENSLNVAKKDLMLENEFNLKLKGLAQNHIDSFSGSDIPKLEFPDQKNNYQYATTGLLNPYNRPAETLDITGSFIKELDPRKIVKVKVGDTCFGYYYVELDERTEFFKNGTAYGSLELRSAVDLRTDAEYISDPKTRLIVDIFAKNIARKLNKKFIEDNKDFKELIYELVKQDYIVNKRIEITYLAPNEVEHLMVEEDRKTGYGISRFKSILFTAKLYLAVLTCTLMMKISRSQDHRTFYVETGLSKDVEGIIQSFVREIKAKEVKLSDLKSIDSIFNSIGQFSDYFIPQINGEKAVDIDTVAGMNAEIENEFLEYLKKTMISGMGIPASFLQYSDEMEFARSVSMMNGMFLRKIIGMQKKLGVSFSEIYRKLYKNEYEPLEQTGNGIGNDRAFNIDYAAIEAKFPPPASLNMTNLIDQIASAQNVIEFIVNTLIGQSADGKLRDAVQKAVVKKILPNIEWDVYEALLEEVIEEIVRGKLDVQEVSAD